MIALLKDALNIRKALFIQQYDHIEKILPNDFGKNVLLQEILKSKFLQCA